MSLSALGVPAPCEKFPQSANCILNNFWSTESISISFVCFWVLFASVCYLNTHPKTMKESSGQTSQSLKSTLSSRQKVTVVNFRLHRTARRSYRIWGTPCLRHNFCASGGSRPPHLHSEESFVSQKWKILRVFTTRVSLVRFDILLQI
jgi:hypothetical protein